jgi:hypothetical protein
MISSLQDIGELQLFNLNHFLVDQVKDIDKESTAICKKEKLLSDSELLQLMESETIEEKQVVYLVDWFVTIKEVESTQHDTFGSRWIRLNGNRINQFGTIIERKVIFFNDRSSQMKLFPFCLPERFKVLTELFIL